MHFAGAIYGKVYMHDTIDRQDCYITCVFVSTFLRGSTADY